MAYFQPNLLTLPRIDFEYFTQEKPPSPSYIEIILADFSQGRNGAPLLSSKLYSKSEVDDKIDLLIDQLEGIRKKAKSKLS